MNAENITSLWSIGLDAANHTLKTTTQIGVQHAVRPLSRRYRINTQMLHYRRLDTPFYSDTKFAKVRSLKGNTCYQVFVAVNVVHVQPMPTKSDTGRSLQVFTEDIGIPNSIVVNGAKEQTGPNSAFIQNVRQLKMMILNTEPYSQWQNRCETTVGLLKKRWIKNKAHKNVHWRIWYYALVYYAEILSQPTRKKAIAPDMRKSQVTHPIFQSGVISASMIMYVIGTHPATTPQPPRLDDGSAFPIVLVVGFVTGFCAKMAMFFPHYCTAHDSPGNVSRCHPG